MVRLKSDLSGRGKQAATNDELIIEAARAVFVADPGAPISAVAARAGVGFSALYRRYASKDDLLQAVCRDGLQRHIAEVESALADDSDPWSAFVSFMNRIVEGNTHALTVRVAGTFKPSAELYALAEVAQNLNIALFERLRRAGALRPGVEVNDINAISEMLAGLSYGNTTRDLALRKRYLIVFLDGISARATGKLPNHSPTWEDIQRRWSGEQPGQGDPSSIYEKAKVDKPTK